MLVTPGSQRVNNIILSRSEGLPGVLDNKGTWPFTFREQGNKRKNITGNTGYVLLN